MLKITCAEPKSDASTNSATPARLAVITVSEPKNQIISCLPYEYLEIAVEGKNINEFYRSLRLYA